MTWITDPYEDAPNVSVYAVSHSSLTFLTSLCEPIIPDELFNHCLEYSPDLNKTRTFLPSLPFYHKIFSNYLRTFLHEILRHSQERNNDEQIFAEIFGDIVLRKKGCVECKLTEERTLLAWNKYITSFNNYKTKYDEESKNPIYEKVFKK